MAAVDLTDDEACRLRHAQHLGDLFFRVATGIGHA
jgi:hypothetical protein